MDITSLFFCIGSWTMPIYRHGKMKKPIEFQRFKEVMAKGEFKSGNYHRSFLAFLYWFGVRRGEALAMKPTDFKVDKAKGVLLVNCPSLKGGERELLECNLKLPYAVLILKEVVKAIKMGREKVWDFCPTTAWLIVKRAMGQKYYPHFFRLNRATHFLEDSTTTIPEMKAWFGWKSTETIDHYIGISRKYIKTQSKRLDKEVEQTK